MSRPLAAFRAPESHRCCDLLQVLLAASWILTPWQPETWPECAGLAAHIEAAVTYAEPYPKQARRCSALLGNLVPYLAMTVQYAAARTTLERALAIKEVAYGPDHPEVAMTLGNLGIVQQQLGDLAAARITLERALAIKEAARLPDAPADPACQTTYLPGLRLLTWLNGSP